MKYNLFWVLGFWVLLGPLQAAPSFWVDPNATPTPPSAPQIQDWGETTEEAKPTATPVLAPLVDFPTPTPTPLPGLSPKDPTQAAIFSVVVPGAGEVYAGEPLKGIVFAGLFGLGLWQTLDNFQLVRTSAGDLVAKDETAGNLFGLATLAAYGFGIQDAMNSATSFNKRNNLSVSLGLSPGPNASLAFNF